MTGNGAQKPDRMEEAFQMFRARMKQIDVDHEKNCRAIDRDTWILAALLFVLIVMLTCLCVMIQATL